MGKNYVLEAIERAEDIIALQKRVIEKDGWQCCLNCENWNDSTCKKFNATPPPEVLVVGCNGWQYRIPF